MIVYIWRIDSLGLVAAILILNLIFIVIVVGAFGIWLYLLFILKKSFDKSPIIKGGRDNTTNCDLLSVIIPARNEEKYIENCVQSILNQSAKAYEVLIVDDSSEDSTLTIVESFKNNPKVRIIPAGPKPDGWIGKNWPCYVGYKNAKGKYLMFTDADTIHSNNSLTDSLNTLLLEKMDVITAVPRLMYPNFIIKMVLPILSIFMFTRYSPMRVNDPKVELGYLFGSYFVITRECYEKVGTHESVKNEIVEDGALGKKLKEEGFKLRMYRGENLIDAFWARDFSTLWNSLKRLIVPLFFTDKKNSILIAVGIFLLMAFPYLMFSYSVGFYLASLVTDISYIFLLVVSVMCIIAIFGTNFYQLKRASTHKSIYGFGTPVGCFVVSISFLWSILTSQNRAVIKWRGREYDYNKPVRT